MKYPTVRDILAGISDGQMENLRTIAATLGVPLSDLMAEGEAEVSQPHPDHPTNEDLVALGGGFALSSEGRRALGLYILTKDDSYYRRAAAIPDVAPIALMLKKSLLSS